MILSIVGCSNTAPAAPANPSEETTLFKAGTYTSKAQGMGGDVEVEVVLSDNAIDSIKVS